VLLLLSEGLTRILPMLQEPIPWIETEVAIISP
jgi:hypothetical protein